MKSYLKKSSFILSIILLISFSCNKTDNKYDLKIISNLSDYYALVEENPDNKLVDIKKIIPDIYLDIRYATKKNFTNQIIYKSAKAYIRVPVADSLQKIQKELIENGMSLKIFDAYRPYAATVRFYKVFPDTSFVAAPWKGSIHNRGCAVDLTIVDLKTKMELEMPTLFDDFTEKASHKYNDLPEHVINNRKILLEIMLKYGFEIYENEWWHYSFIGWDKFDLMDITIEDLNKNI